MKASLVSFSLMFGAALCLNPSPVSAEKQHDLFKLSIGAYDVIDDEDDAIDLRAEYQWRSVVFLNHIKPWAGIEITTDKSVWAGGGFLFDWKLLENVFLTPSLGLGLYDEGSSDLDLDYPLQFRSELELSYQFQDQSRIGLGFSHLSNAGLGDHNPGTEVLFVSYSIPLGKLF